ncbi:MAG: radical SAM protein [bacterium]|nr:radical SAM protein [bacterium]
MLNKAEVFTSFVKKVYDNLIPFEVLLELTYRCNLKCIHCWVGEPPGEELTTEEWKNILNQLADAGTFSISFTGGEPFLRDDWLELSLYAKKLHFAISFLTNGTLITPAIAKALKDVNPVNVEVSLHGATPETHDQITQVKGSFKKVINAIHYLREEKIHVVASTRIMNVNFQEVPYLDKLIKELGIVGGMGYAITPPHTSEEQIKRPVEKIRISLHQFSCIFPFIYPDISKTIRRRLEIKPFCNNNIFNCGAGISVVLISPKGDVYPCTVLHLKAGSLRLESFKEIWTQSELLLQLRELRNTPSPICSNCDLSFYCSRCPGLALLEGKDIGEPPDGTCERAALVKEKLEVENPDLIQMLQNQEV